MFSKSINETVLLGLENSILIRLYKNQLLFAPTPDDLNFRLELGVEIRLAAFV